MSRTQAAEYLGVGLKFMTRYRDHKIPHRHIGRRLMFLPEELEEWVDVGEDSYVGHSCPTCDARGAHRGQRRPGPGDEPTAA
ncbi:helix-turn-helix domain-containing protein [Geodermatophilus sp. SYSU D00684]